MLRCVAPGLSAFMALGVTGKAGVHVVVVQLVQVDA